jgi:excisionase family DNA binding protein
MQKRMSMHISHATRTSRRRPRSLRDIASILGISYVSVWRILHGQASKELTDTYRPLIMTLLGETKAQDKPSDTDSDIWERLPPSLTTHEAAYLLNCDPKTIRQLCRLGILAHTRLRREYRIHTRALRHFALSSGIIPMDTPRSFRSRHQRSSRGGDGR